MPLSLFESEALLDFLHKLNPAYKPPTRKTISNTLLTNVYDGIKVDVSTILQDLQHINIVTDESTNVNGSRILNLSINTPRGSFHWISEDIGSRQFSATEIVTWLKSQLQILTNNDLKRVNSIATDTCPIMLKMWKELRQFSELRHCFTIPCDSHGLQLLIKDILKLDSCKTTLQEAQCIVKLFKTSPLQHARLRGFQLETYGKHIALILSVLTRWGTQYGLVTSVLSNKMALRSFVKEFTRQGRFTTRELDLDAFKHINDSGFWERLSLLQELLKPLDEAITMSESNKAHLGKVVPRWASILSHLNTMKDDFPDLQQFLSPEGEFFTRFKRQVGPLHRIAFYLDPINNKTPIDAECETQIYQFFRDFSATEWEADALMDEFADYRLDQNGYETTRYCWKWKNSPRDFWRWIQQDSTSRLLPQIAVRIFSCAANSVTSERAFSTQNFLHNKIRNRLQATRVDKLIFIYMNQRVLQTLKNGDHFSVSDTSSPTSDLPLNLTEAEAVVIEDAILEDNEIMDNDEIEDEMDELEMDLVMMEE